MTEPEREIADAGDGIPGVDPTESEVLEALADTNRAIQRLDVSERRNPTGLFGAYRKALEADREALLAELGRIRRPR